MKLTVKIDTVKLTAALLKASNIVRPILRKEMGTQLEEVRSKAASAHRFISRGGFLERSIRSKVSPAGLQGSVFLDGGIAPYAEFVHEGTGIYGPKRQPFYVKPKNKKALHWGKKFSKGHWIRGMRPDRFLTSAFKENVNQIIDGLSNAYNEALQKAGLV